MEKGRRARIVLDGKTVAESRAGSDCEELIARKLVKKRLGVDVEIDS